jgi:membrane protein YqaA with SNARE-associated domain
VLPGEKMNSVASLSALFASSFLAATLLPGGSELVLFAVLQQPGADAWLALIVATVGNTLGGMTSYLIGRIVPQRKPHSALSALRRYGTPALLLSWVPIVGDALCVAAGWLRMNAGRAALFMALGKFSRYAAITALA